MASLARTSIAASVGCNGVLGSKQSSSIPTNRCAACVVGVLVLAGHKPARLTPRKWTFWTLSRPICTFCLANSYGQAYRRGVSLCIPTGVHTCWPQAEPFNAAEMALLASVEAWSSTPRQDRQHLWEVIQTQSLAVRPRRRGYVLSVLMNSEPSFHFALLPWVLHEKDKMQWL